MLSKCASGYTRASMYIATRHHDFQCVYFRCKQFRELATSLQDIQNDIEVS